MSYPTLLIGSIQIPLHALIGGFSQTYEEIAGISSARMGDGSLTIQRAWPTVGKNYKLSTTISGAGSLPAPLDGLNRGAAVEVECATHRAIGSASNIITLPTGRRSGGIYDPVGYALVNGLLVPTPLVIVSHVATLTTVSGAQHYQVRYWPKFSGRITHQSSGEPWQARRSWSITIEEV
jgi:hypothetical protein